MKEIVEKIRQLSKKELIDLSYSDLIEMINQLTPDEIIELSNKIGYPVFTRLCMGVLRHKFVLLQDGAAAIIVNQEGQLLLQRRADRDNWGLPGGCQELGERFEETVVREIEEETGLIISEEDLELIAIVSGNSRRNEYPNGDVVINNTALYMVTNYTGELRWNEESKEMRFFDLEGIPPKERQNDPDLIEEYKKYLQKNKSR